MKVFLKAYFNTNLGDDLFIQIFANRYKNQNICIAEKKLDASNITIVRENFFQKVLKKITKYKFSLEKKLMKECDINVLLGGSMFIEKDNTNSNSNINLLNNDCYIIGTNFGPYKTERYYENYKNMFSKAKDICFRESYSLEQFKDLSNVRIAPDIIFSLNTKNIKITNNKKVVISVINCGKKVEYKYVDKYEKLIIDLIDFFRKEKYEIVLMSFCENEGDEEAIKSIMSKLTDNTHNISIYFYKGNLEEALNILGDCQIIVGSRFHANIIGMVLEKNIIPIAYSDKTINVLHDIEYKGKYIDLREIDKFNIDELNAEDLKYNYNISSLKKEAEKHFKKLDLILERNDQNDKSK